MTTIVCELPTPLAAISLDSIPPEIWTAILTAVLTLAVSAAHARGRRLPLIEWILDTILAAPSPRTPAESEPVTRELLAELKAWRERAHGTEKNSIG